MTRLYLETEMNEQPKGSTKILSSLGYPEPALSSTPNLTHSHTHSRTLNRKSKIFARLQEMIDHDSLIGKGRENDMKHLIAMTQVPYISPPLYQHFYMSTTISPISGGA